MPDAPAFDPRPITRPDPALLRYYLLVCILTGPAYPIAVIPLVLKYWTLRYRFDDEGISMSWGVLFRRETVLTYRRIQDIHVTRNIIQRWLGLATVSIQTASGNAGAEMAIEGVLEAEPLRDFLYGRMRGVRGRGVHDPAEPGPVGGPVATTPGSADEALTLLRDIRDSLAKLAARPGSGS